MESSHLAALLSAPPTKVLDLGFVRLVDMMGDDWRIVQAARVSTGQGLKSVDEDSKLLRYLLRQRHTTPFEKVRFEFHVKLPIFVARQWIRHRMGSFNEISGRYAELLDEFYVPDVFRKQSASNRQGGEIPLEDKDSGFLREYVKRSQHEAYECYKHLLARGVAREQARIVLPLSIYTEWYWTVDLHNLFHFLKLRTDTHAQQEMRAYADAIEAIVALAVPVAWGAYRDYMKHAVTLSLPEQQRLRGEPAEMTARELTEYEAKRALLFPKSTQEQHGCGEIGEDG